MYHEKDDSETCDYQLELLKQVRTVTSPVHVASQLSTFTITIQKNLSYITMLLQEREKHKKEVDHLTLELELLKKVIKTLYLLPIMLKCMYTVYIRKINHSDQCRCCFFGASV